MSAPTVSKTWQHTYSGGHSTNVRLLSSGVALTDYQTAMKRIKDIMIGFTNAPWSVLYSCDGTTAGTAGDLVDRWSAIAKLVWANAGVAHSWIILKQTGIASNFQLCIDLSNSTSSNATVVFSPNAGFTGGTTTARPTATDEVVILSNTTWLSGSGSPFTGALSVMMTSDGQCTRVLFFRAGFAEGWWILDKPAAAVTGWSQPFFGLITGGNGGQGVTLANSINTTSGKGVVRIGTTTGVTSITTEDYTSGSEQAAQRQLTVHDLVPDQGYCITPAGIAVPSTVGARGRHGYLSDLWVVPSGSLRVGDTLPNDNTRAIIIAGVLAMPWNGEQPKVN